MRAVYKVAAIAAVPLSAFVSAGPAAADGPLYFDPVQVTVAPGCSGKVTAEIQASQGQQAREFANFIDSSTRVTVGFTPDSGPAPSGSTSPSNAADCEVTTTVTMRNLDTGASMTDTQTTQYDSHYGWHAAFFTLPGSGHVAVQVSTNPSPSELTIEVPAPF
ncbi:hypothetical protein [Nocardia sp. CDC160]|uniref:hypothetical protein n=1 Tax=Nocardia sp. CDC160 TaxID=3112166 RepID=UPI002DBDCE05|nr:hypothetical protein [Nocardia sp. CDC160]MEC3918374.1 hypothetical protein [Nocardia sp. CDC160]